MKNGTNASVAAPTGPALYERAKGIIPGGTQLLSKRPEMFLPDQWPAYYASAKGAEVVDLDGRTFVDCATVGIGATILGFADPDVDGAVKRCIDLGQMCTLNAPEEVELAELLLELHPWADMVRYARGGGEMMAVALRLARAATGRDHIAFCGYHGWHDWYLAANLNDDAALDGHLLPGLEPAGVPRGLRGSIHPFHYNSVEELEAIVAEHGPRLAAIVMEPARSQGPEPGFLEAVRAIADRTGAVLIFDEVTSGFRLNSGGVHMVYGVEPDIAAFAKALGNGYPMAAVVGRRAVMEAAQKSFISSTSWTERIGPTAALAMIRKHRERDVASHLVAVGERVQEGWTRAAEAAGLPIHVSGLAPLSHFDLRCEEAPALLTLFIQELLDRGYLASASFYACFAHEDRHVEGYLAAVGEAFGIMARAREAGDVRERLRGPVKHTGFKRLT